ncbi:MAG TPA: hypothetical protein VIL54_16375 [Natronosporangium sp.]|jgi:hypothetical protein
MSDRNDLHRVERALRSLADTFAAHTVPPPAADLRARATRQLRVRRTATVLTAATAVAALVIGGAHALDLAGPSTPPAHTPTGRPSPTTTPTPTASPTPPLVPPVTPSPRPAPRPSPPPPDDPITQVNWRDAALTLPPHDTCPSGPVRFAPYGGPDGYPRAESGGKGIELYPDGPYTPRIAYGDVTGDGQPEAVIAVQCFLADGVTGPTGHGGHLLVVGRSGDGTLSGLGWVGPYSADIHEVWVADDGRVLMVGDPWTVDPEDHFPAIPGLVLSYRWDGTRFEGWEPAPEYPPIVPLDLSGAGPPVRPGAVAAGLGCPDVELRFRPDNGWGGTATAAGARFVIPALNFQQYLFDLDHTGDRLLVVSMECTGPDGWTREGLAVFERAGDGWQGISVLTPPPGRGLAGVESWEIDDEGAFLVSWRQQVAGDGVASSLQPHRYRWTGTELVPAD